MFIIIRDEYVLSFLENTMELTRYVTKYLWKIYEIEFTRADIGPWIKFLPFQKVLSSVPKHGPYSQNHPK